MKKLKISLKELILLIILSASIGSFLFLNYSNKIKLEIKAMQGYAIAENFCENYTYQKIGLSYDGIDEALNLSSKSYGVIKVLFKKNLGIYEISINGVDGEEQQIVEEANRILEKISELELTNFNRFYKSIRIHCKSNDFAVFKLSPIEKINNYQPIKKIKLINLLLLFIYPLIILYLFIISYKFIFKK